MSLTKWMNQCFHYYYCYTNNNRITGTCTASYDENRVKSGVASSANNKISSTNNNKITLILILSIISTSTSVLAAEDYFEIRVDPLGNAVEILKKFNCFLKVVESEECSPTHFSQGNISDPLTKCTFTLIPQNHLRSSALF